MHSPRLLLSALEKAETTEFAQIPQRRLIGSVDYAISSKHRDKRLCRNIGEPWGCSSEKPETKETFKTLSMSSVPSHTVILLDYVGGNYNPVLK